MKGGERVSKEEIAVEILKLCAEDISRLEWKSKMNKSDYAGRLAKAYNAILAAISVPQNAQ